MNSEEDIRRKLGAISNLYKDAEAKLSVCWFDVVYKSLKWAIDQQSSRRRILIDGKVALESPLSKRLEHFSDLNSLVNLGLELADKKLTEAGIN